MRPAILIMCLAASAHGAEIQRRFVLGTPLELGVFPAQVQVSSATQHVGVGLGLGWHLNDAVMVLLSGLYNYVSETSPFSREVIAKVRTEDMNPALTVWGAFAGVEFAPLRGQSNLGWLSVVFSGAIGAGNTRHQLKPANESGPATYGDTGFRFLSTIGAGFRLELNERFSIRLAVSDLIVPSGVQTINGCNAADLSSLHNSLLLRLGGPVTLSSGCRSSAFGFDRSTGNWTKQQGTVDARSSDIPLANSILKQPHASTLVHHATVHLGATIQF